MSGIRKRLTEVLHTMDDVSNLSTCQLEKSTFVRPFRINYTQDGRQKVWDCVFSHRAVSVILYNTSREKLILVKQFRPAVYFDAVRHEKGLTADDIGKPLDTSTVPATRGVCLELCGGIIGIIELFLVSKAREDKQFCLYLPFR